jgi:hypothetical protein
LIAFNNAARWNAALVSSSFAGHMKRLVEVTYEMD